MNEHWQKIKEWYANLAPREKNAVNVGGVALAIFMIYAAIWSPLDNAVVANRARIKSAQKTLQWMEAADKQIAVSAGTASTGTEKLTTPVALLSYLQNKTNQLGLAPYLSEMKQTNNDGITLQFQKVEFDALIKFITTLSKEQGMTVTQFSATADTTPGLTNVEMQVSVV